jgi:hypothetical protein
MPNDKCAVCGHINRADAALCDMCESSLGGATGADVGQQFYAYADYGEAPRAGVLSTDVPSPRFQRMRDVFAPTLDFFRNHFLLVGSFVVVASIPLAALRLSLGYSFWPTEILIVAANAFMLGASTYAVIEVQRTGKVRAGDCFRWAVRKLPKLFLVNLIYMAGVMIGWIFIIVPGVIISLMYGLAVPAAAAENRGVIESFQRSRQLTDGYKGLLFITNFLWGLAVFLGVWLVKRSFVYSGTQFTASAVVLQTLAGQMLYSTSNVLTVFVFLGILNERRLSFGTRTFTPAPGTSAR